MLSLRSCLFITFLVLATGCSEKSSKNSDDFNTDLSMPPSQSLSSDELAAAQDLFQQALTITQAVDSLNGNNLTPQRNGDAIASRCEMHQQDTSSGNQIANSVWLANRAGQTCPLSFRRDVQGNTTSAPSGFNVQGQTNTILSVIDPGSLNNTILRRIEHSGPLSVRFQDAGNTIRLRGKTEQSGQVVLSDLGTFSFIYKLASDMTSTQQEQVVAAQVSMAYGVELNGKWLILRINARLANNQPQINCSLNGADLSQTDFCHSLIGAVIPASQNIFNHP